MIFTCVSNEHVLLCPCGMIRIECVLYFVVSLTIFHIEIHIVIKYILFFHTLCLPFVCSKLICIHFFVVVLVVVVVVVGW